MRNFLNVGDYATLMPIGLQCTIQYNASGNYEKLYIGFDDNRIQTELFDDVINVGKIIPLNIDVKGGTSWVKGVFYTGELSKVSGLLPECAKNVLSGKLIENPEQFNFFASSIDGTSISFPNYDSMRYKLAASKFKVLPCWKVVVPFTPDTVTKWVESAQYTFLPIVTDIGVFRNSTIIYYNLHKTEQVIKDVNTYTDYDGNLISDLTFLDGSKRIISYADVLKYGIGIDTVIIFNSDGDIEFSRYCVSVDANKPITCSYCGKQYIPQSVGNICCPDIHCSSKLVPRIMQMLSVLKLPMVDKKVISDWIANGDIICITDVLLLPPYNSIFIDATFSDILRALIPQTLLPNDDILLEFSLACSGNIQTFTYYISNPQMIYQDLGIVHDDLNRLIMWLTDSTNHTDVNTLIGTDTINICTNNRLFDGPPIFRGKTICITGKFIHGSLSDVAQILQSYSAKVTTKFSDLTDCIIVGGVRENIDGKLLRAAKSSNRPIFEELDFFKNYDIDSDIKSGGID